MTPLDVAGLTAALILLFVLPGITWAPVLAPTSRGGRVELLGRVAGASLVVSGIVCTLLAWLHVLSPASILIGLGVVTAVPLASGAVRRSFSLAVDGAREWADRFRLLTTIGVVGVAMLLSSSRAADAWLPTTTTSWYYAGLAAATAAGSGFPSTTVEWGTTLPFQTDYLVFTAHSAAFFALGGQGPSVLALEAYRLAILAGLLLSWVLLASRFLPTWIAICSAVALFANPWMQDKLQSFRPETFGIVVTFFAAWLTDRAVTRRDRRLVVAAAIAGAVIFLSHAEVFLIWLCLGAASLVVRVAWPLLARGFGGLPGRPIVRRTLARGWVAALVVVASVAIGIGANVLITGQARILGYGMQPAAVVSDEVITELESVAPRRWKPSGDLTWDFVKAVTTTGGPVPRRLTDPRVLRPDFLVVWPGLDAATLLGRIGLVAIGLATILCWPLLPGRARRGLIFAVVTAGVLAAGALFINTVATTYVPRRIGGQRLLPYEILPVVLTTAILVTALAALAVRGFRGRVRRFGPGLIAAGTLVMALVGTSFLAPKQARTGTSPLGYVAMQDLARTLAPNAVVLTNLYTDGAGEMLLHRTSVLDGRATYLEHPELLVRSLRQALGARRFFAAPDASDARMFLAELGITDLVIIGPDGAKADLGGTPAFRTDYEELAEAPYLVPVRAYGGAHILVYHVVDQGALGPTARAAMAAP